MVIIIGRIIMLYNGFGKAPVYKGSLWRGANPHRPHCTERWIEVYTCCSANYIFSFLDLNKEMLLRVIEISVRIRRVTDVDGATSSKALQSLFKTHAAF